MRYSRIGLLLFTVVSGAILVFLAWYSPLSKNPIDRHTGEEISEEGVPVIRQIGVTAEQVLDDARGLGDARLALAHIRVNSEEVRNPAALLGAVDVLTAEVMSPEDGLVRARRLGLDARLTRARERLEASLVDPLPLPEVVTGLRVLGLDDGVGERTEQFFRPMAMEWEAGEDLQAAVKRYAPPDRIAAVAIHRAGGRAADVSAGDCLLVARAYRAADRPRARFRWLLRALAVDPSEEVALKACAAYLEYGRQLEALSVLDVAAQAGADSEELWQRVVDISAWNSIPRKESEGLEMLLRHEPDVKRRDRLIDLYGLLGFPEYAAPHVVARARERGTPEALQEAAILVMGVGDMDRAFELLEEACEAADDPRPWRERLVGYYLEDMRLDSAIAEVKRMNELWPDAGYDEQLERLLRRKRGLPEVPPSGPEVPVVKSADEELADLLVLRLARKPDPQLEEEVIGLCSSLGQMDRVQRLMMNRVRRIGKPSVFFLQLSLYRAMGLVGLPEVARDMVRSPKLEADDLPVIIGVLEDVVLEPGYREVVDALAERYPRDSRVKEFQLRIQERLGDPRAAAEAAESHAKQHPGDDVMLKAWIDRASWAGLVESEIRALTIWIEAHPEDAPLRHRLARLLLGEGRAAKAVPHLRWLAERDGPGSESEELLIDTLLSAGFEEEALTMMEEKSRRPELSAEERFRLAERFFGAQWMELSLTLYLTLLEQDPDDARVLLRVGQIRAFGNDPYGAIPLFRRVLELEGEGDGEVLYLLGEAYWAADRESEALEAHQRALPLLADPTRLTVPREGSLARILARLGRPEEAVAICERITAREPDNLDLLLDYADLLIMLDRLEAAREIVTEARCLQEESRRVLRVHGQLCMKEGKPEEALASLLEARDVYGPDAGLYTDLGEALMSLGRVREANEAYADALELQPGSVTTAWVLRRASDRLASPILETEIGYRQVGDHDRAFAIREEGSFLLDEHRTRLSALLGWWSSEGRASAVDAGLTDVSSGFAFLGAGLSRRFDDDWEAGGGLDLYLGREDAVPVGLWAAGRRYFRKPYVTLGARFHLNEPFYEPFAANGLSGATHGLELDGYFAPQGAWWWASGRLELRSLSIDHPDEGNQSDGQVRGELVLGALLSDSGPHVTERLRPRHVPSVTEGTTVGSEPPSEEGPRISIWLGYNPIRLLDDKELTDSLPIGDRFDYLTATGRAEGRVGRGVFFEAEGYVGTDLGDPRLIGGVLLGLAWRPRAGLEVRAQGGYGHAFGRTEGNAGAFQTALALTLSW